jgi:hypothetical protein
LAEAGDGTDSCERLGWVSGRGWNEDGDSVGFGMRALVGGSNVDADDILGEASGGRRARDTLNLALIKRRCALILRR